jgi:hypothetical protein
MKYSIMILLLILSLFSCVGNFFPGEEETGEADRRRCNLATIALVKENERGRNCDFCLAGMLIYCNKKESKQLIQLK